MDRLESVGIGLAYADEFQSGHAVSSSGSFGSFGSSDSCGSRGSSGPLRSWASYFSCSISPFTNSRCMKITSSTGGSIASIDVAMISCHTGSESGTATMR